MLTVGQLSTIRRNIIRRLRWYNPIRDPQWAEAITALRMVDTQFAAQNARYGYW